VESCKTSVQRGEFAFHAIIADLSTVHFQLMANRIDRTADTWNSMIGWRILGAWKCR